MKTKKIRLIYLAITPLVVVLGLSSRKFDESLPAFIADYAGDTLWALMVFLGISFLLPDLPVMKRGGFALAFSYFIEVSQLYHAPWIDALRETTLGGLILGFGFLWTDLICYTVGIAFGAMADLQMRKPDSMSEPTGQGDRKTSE